MPSTLPTERAPVYPRHSFVYVSESAWAAWLEGHPELRRQPIVKDWVTLGRPLIVRRWTPSEIAAGYDHSGSSTPLGLALPPTSSLRRVGLSMARDSLLATRPPPFPMECDAAAPPEWLACLQALATVPQPLGAEVRVFGSLAWSQMTGLNYLTSTSDLDLTITCAPGPLKALLAALDAISGRAPMRIDAEIVRVDGRAAHWRELSGDTIDVMVKTETETRLCDRLAFLER